MSRTVAIIAGAGQFPFHVAQEAKRQGFTVLGVGLRGWVDPRFASQVDGYEELPVGQLRRLLDWLKTRRVSQAVMAGKVTKEVLLGDRASFDEETLGLLRDAKEFSVTALLGAVAQRLAGEGITLLDSSTFLHSNLCPEGVLTARGPTAQEREDIAVGQRAARTIAGSDIGQTVVVKARVVVAVEALEGTDAVIRRAHELAGPGLVVVKAAAANQDRRFDLPLVGPQTVATLVAAQVSCLAMEAGSTLLLDRETIIREANAADICLMGIQPPHVPTPCAAPPKAGPNAESL